MTIKSTMRALHARYDGPVPEHARALAKAGSPERQAYLQATGRLRGARTTVRFAIGCIRDYRNGVGSGRCKPDHERYGQLVGELERAWKWYCDCTIPAADAIRKYNAAGRPGERKTENPGVALMRDFGRALLNEAAE